MLEARIYIFEKTLNFTAPLRASYAAVGKANAQFAANPYEMFG